MKVHLLLEIGNNDQPVKSVHTSLTNAKHRLDEIEAALQQNAARVRPRSKVDIIRASETSLLVWDESQKRIRTYIIDTREALGSPLEMLAEEAG